MFEQFRIYNEKRGEKEADHWEVPFNETLGRYVWISGNTGVEYQLEDFFLNSINPCLDDVFEVYKEHAKWANKIWTTDAFVLYWLSQMVILNATYHADYKRLNYLEENLTDDTNRKQVGKIHKRSEEIYSEEYLKYLKIHEEL